MQTQLLIESNQGDWRENYDAFFKNGMFHDQRAEHSHPAAAAHLTQVKPISFRSGPSHSGKSYLPRLQMCESQILCSVVFNFE